MNTLCRKRIALAFVLSISCSSASFGQNQSRLGGLFNRGNNTPQAPAARPAAPPAQARTPANAVGNTPANTKVDPATVRTNGVLPGLTPVDELSKVQINLPTEPVEPYLLTKQAGPFMVIAHTFRGPDAVRWAQALAMELRSSHQLMAYIYFKKIKPMNSNVRGVPPTSNPEDGEGRISEPEIYRIYDEAVVLVGDKPTMKEAEDLLKFVKKIKPATLSNVPSIFPWRTGAGLKNAIVTANPLIPAQELFARESDPLVEAMNKGPYSIYNCPGPYTLVVARFVGRSAFGEGDKDFLKDDNLKTSPLAKATDDAELMAAELNKDPQFKQAGYQAYVYHDRNKSVVTLGHFNNKVENEKIFKDQKVQSIRQHLDKLNQQYLTAGKLAAPLSPTDMMEVPKASVKQKASGGLFNR